MSLLSSLFGCCCRSDYDRVVPEDEEMRDFAPRKEKQLMRETGLDSQQLESAASPELRKALLIQIISLFPAQLQSAFVTLGFFQALREEPDLQRGLLHGLFEDLPDPNQQSLLDSLEHCPDAGTDFA